MEKSGPVQLHYLCTIQNCLVKILQKYDISNIKFTRGATFSHSPRPNPGGAGPWQLSPYFDSVPRAVMLARCWSNKERCAGRSMSSRAIS